MTNKELLELAIKPFVTARDIKKMSMTEGNKGKGINQCRKLMKEIIQNEAKNMLLPPYKVPTRFVNKRLGIDVKDLLEKVKIEKELNELNYQK